MDKIVAFSTLVEIARAKAQNRNADAEELFKIFESRTLDSRRNRSGSNVVALKEIAISLKDGTENDKADFFRSLAGY